jgi:hypothetical protein
VDKPSRWPAWAVLAGTVLVAALVGLSLWRYPRNLDDPQAPAYLAVLGALVVLYAALAGSAARRPRTGLALGVLAGSVAALMWAVEIWAGGPAKFDKPVESAVGGLFALLAVAVTVAAGPVAAAVLRDRGAALRCGVFAGLASGLLVFCFGVLMTLSTLGILATRSDYQRQFLRSHAADIHTFLVGDILAATTAHLAINLLLGVFGGGIGALIAGGLRQPATVTPG